MQVKKNMEPGSNPKFGTGPVQARQKMQFLHKTIAISPEFVKDLLDHIEILA
jgi:hypothetical protein